MKEAFFSGSFDPPTLGHLDIIGRAASIFEKLTVLIAFNREKTGLFTFEERLTILEELCRPYPNVKVAGTDQLITFYLKENRVQTLVRGVRNEAEFRKESDMAFYNRSLLPGTETLLLPAKPEFASISSSGVKEVAAFGGDLRSFIPDCVADALTRKSRK
jgi:pantetheine-phosphate adenylyltransferase